MDTYFREIGMQMQTYSINGVRVKPRDDDTIVHAVLVAYLKKVQLAPDESKQSPAHSPAHSPVHSQAHSQAHSTGIYR